MSNPEPLAGDAWCEKHRRGLLFTLLAVCLGLRVWLAATGGQGYWPDEMRYSSASREAAWQFAHGHSREAWLALIGQADHLLFKIIGLPAAFWELKFGNNGTLVASWFGLFSVASIGLLYGVARAAGASAREGLLAVFFAAGSSSLFYYCRHYFPYDVSLCFCLLALWLSLGPPNAWRTLLAGLAAGMGFLSYNGYWLLGGAILVFHVLSAGGWPRRLARAVLAGGALLAPVVAAVLAARAINRDLIASFREFSQTINQGDFGRGWRLIVEYLWSAEGLSGLAWGGLICVGLVLRGKRRRILLWLGFAAALYLGLVVSSDVLRTFVVYGRTARILVPFLCLAAAAAAEGALIRWPSRQLGWTLIVGVTVAAGWQMAPALRQAFPDDFLRDANSLAQRTRVESRTLLRVLNADRLSEGLVMSEPRPHEVLLRRSHPLQFGPYLYEGFGEARRTLFQREDISMQLVAVPSVRLPDIGGGYPGPLRVRVKFPANRYGISEPLLTSGESGRANFVYVRYVDPGHIQFGYDCWSCGGTLGDPVSVDFAKEHELLLSCGAQFSPAAAPPADLEPAAWRQLQGSVFVALDGAVALAERAATNPADPRTITIGTNFAGGSSARQSFSGEVRGIERLAWNEVLKRLAVENLSLRALAQLVADASPGPDWNGFCGPLRLKLRFPAGAAGQAEPLLVTGVSGKGDFLYVRYLADGRVTFGFDHWGVGGAESAPVSLADTRRAEVVISCGGLMPPRGAKIYEANAAAGALRENVVVSVDGRVVFVAAMASHPTLPANISLGRNQIGGSTAAARFGGEIYSLGSEPAAAVLRMLAPAVRAR